MKFFQHGNRVLPKDKIASFYIDNDRGQYYVVVELDCKDTVYESKPYKTKRDADRAIEALWFKLEGGPSSEKWRAK